MLKGLNSRSKNYSNASLPAKMEKIYGSRVGSHVVSVRIHCTEKWRTSFHTDVLSKSK